MTPKEARKIAYHHLGDMLRRVDRQGSRYQVVCDDGAIDHSPTAATGSTVAEAAADCAAQLRAAGWVPTHPRLEWQRDDGKWLLTYRHEGLRLPLYRVFASECVDDFGADSLDNGASAYGSFDFVWSAIAVHCARRIPSLHLPPFPGASDAA